MSIVQSPMSKVRPQFNFLYTDKHPYKVIVAARGSGKTVAVIQKMVQLMFDPNTPMNSSIYFFSTTLRNAKKTVVPVLRELLGNIPDNLLKFNKNDGVYELKFGRNDIREIHLATYTDPDKSRGAHPFGAFLDEAGEMPYNMFDAIVYPMFANRSINETNLIIIGTAKGHNRFYDLFKRGEDPKYCDRWKSYSLPASGSGLISPEKIKEAKHDMSEQLYNQEYECDFDASLGEGAVYAPYLYDKEQFHDVIPTDTTKPVHISMDIGWNDCCSCWFFQENGSSVNLIDFYEERQQDIAYHAAQILKKPYNFGLFILPHDCVSHHVESSNTVFDVISNFGFHPIKLERTSNRMLGIEGAKLLLQEAEFSESKCIIGINHLRNYRMKIDSFTGINTFMPIHDEHSNAADAFRYIVESKGYWANRGTIRPSTTITLKK